MEEVCEQVSVRGWPLTPKIDRATWVFLKSDMRHKAY